MRDIDDLPCRSIRFKMILEVKTSNAVVMAETCNARSSEKSSLWLDTG